MTLISLLIVLGLERVTTKTQFWRSDFYLTWYSNALREQGWFMQESKPWLLYVAVIGPAVILGYLLGWLDSAFISFLVNIAILVIAIGCPQTREQFKGYLQASNRGDFAARDLYAEQMGYNPESGYSFGQFMVWVNFRYYFAVAFWFAIFGAAGAMAYVIARHMRAQTSCDYSNQATAQLMFALDWLPARFAGLGYLLVGHFSRGFPKWLSQASDFTVDGQALVSQVAKASEEIEPDEDDCTEEPCTLLRLAKRNMMMMLAVMAVLTLGGWLN